LYRIGKNLLGTSFGLLWSLVYLCSVLPFFYFKSGIIDPWFNLFIFLGTYHAFQYVLTSEARKKTWLAVLSGLYIGLGILTKGPVALLIFGLTVSIFYVIKMFRVKVKFADLLAFTVVLLFVGGFWFILQMINGNYKIIQDFFVYQVRLFKTEDAGHGGFFLYHFVVLFLGVFPASVFALKSFLHQKRDEREKVHEFKNWMTILFWTVLILFTIVKTKIVHYSSMCYFPLTFLGAMMIFKMQEQNLTIPKWVRGILLGVATFWGLILVGLQLIVKYKSNIIASGIINDPFANGNLQANVSWTGFEFLIGIIFIVGIYALLIPKNLTLNTKIYGTLFLTLFLTYSTMLVIVPRIEGYSQRAAIEFYQEKQNENCYVETLGFKSYADLFYLNKQKPSNPNAWSEEWLIKGNIDKPVYFVIKNYTSKSYLDQNPKIKILYEKNGFVFAKRELNN
jgi:4-amino-4-deoxy-L-arabinose transferase-like glycosyltransferase